MRQPALLAVLAAVALSACATKHDGMIMTGGPPSLTLVAGVVAPPQAKFYADCIAQSVAAGTYDRDDGVIRFKCDGAPAQAFYDGLAAWSTKNGSEYVAEGRNFRTTQKLHHDLNGVDHCWQAPAGNPAYSCVAVFNAGDFIRP